MKGNATIYGMGLNTSLREGSKDPAYQYLGLCCKNESAALPNWRKKKKKKAKRAFKIVTQLRDSRGIRQFCTQRARKRQMSKMHRNGQRRASKPSPFACLKKVVQGGSFREET